MTRRLVLPLLGVAALALAPSALAQCAMCKAVVEGAVEGRRVAEGLNHGILLMMAAPYAIIGSFLAIALGPRLRGALRGKPGPAGE